MVKKHSTPAKASHSSKETRLPKGHPSFNLPSPSGGDFSGAQLNSPMGMGGPPMAPGAPPQGMPM